MAGNDAPVSRQGKWSASGVVLKRTDTAREGMRLTLFLKNYGIVTAYAPWASRGRMRFGMGTEPLSWGQFYLYQSPRNTYLQEINLKESYMSLRHSGSALREAVMWCGAVCSVMPPLVEADDLLTLFWGQFQLLKIGAPAPVMRVRFLWRWLRCLGLAPLLSHCSVCGTEISRPVSLGKWGTECCGGTEVIDFEKFRAIRGAALMPHKDFAEICAAMRPDSVPWAGVSEWLERFFSCGRSIFP